MFHVSIETYIVVSKISIHGRNELLKLFIYRSNSALYNETFNFKEKLSSLLQMIA